jgi:hypothetical protein
MNSEDLKIMLDGLLNVFRFKQIIEEKKYKARQMKKEANKIKRDKYRIRKSVKKSKLQRRIKERDEEERIARLDRKSASDELFEAIPWMTNNIYQDLGFDIVTSAYSSLSYVRQTEKILIFIEEYRPEIAPATKAISNFELYVWYNMVTTNEIDSNIVNGRDELVTNNDLYTWLNMVSISTADMTIIIAENALKMKLLHENVTSFANVGNSNVLMKKSNSRFLEDFSIKENRLLNSDVASRSSLFSISDNDQESDECDIVIDEFKRRHKRKRRGFRFNRSGGLRGCQKSDYRKFYKFYYKYYSFSKRHFEWTGSEYVLLSQLEADHYFAYEPQSLSKASGANNAGDGPRKSGNAKEQQKRNIAKAAKRNNSSSSSSNSSSSNRSSCSSGCHHQIHIVLNFPYIHII